ncbi:MAG: hypothetical protein J7K40_03030 [candidate division Zixibacteria bacterium]|nr:hypothetical protein [candidate division Zixibacteria bacterium]
MNIRIVVASMVTFVILLGVMSYIADKGYDKVILKIEAQRQKTKEQQKMLNQYMRENLKDLGASSEIYGKNINEMIQEEYPDFLINKQKRLHIPYGNIFLWLPSAVWQPE